MRVTLDFPAAEEILQEVGLDEQGDAQMFHTKNVLRRVQKYMPYRTGAPSTSLRESVLARGLSDNSFRITEDKQILLTVSVRRFTNCRLTAKNAYDGK